MKQIIVVLLIFLAAIPAWGASITGDSHAFDDNDVTAGFIERSNSNGQNMVDTFPANLADGQVVVRNANTEGPWIATGSSIDGSPAGYVILGPKQSATLRIENGTIKPIVLPIFAPGRLTTWWVRNFTDDAVRGTLPTPSDANHCLTLEAACASIQAAFDKMRRIFPNLQRQEIVLTWDGTSTIHDYAGAILAWQLPGLPSDYGLTIRGENDGLVRTRIADGLDGGLHVAGDLQVYLRWTAVWTWQTARPAIIAPYGGKIWLDTVVLYGAAGNGGNTPAALLETGPQKGQIAIIGPVHVLDAHTSTKFATCLFNATDGGEIYVQPYTRIYLWWAPRFEVATRCGYMRGVISSYAAWDDASAYPNPGGTPTITTINDGSAYIVPFP